MDKEERAEYNRRYYAERREESREQQRTYRTEHREEKAEYDLRYRAEHKEDIQEYQRKYREEHRGDRQERDQRYHAAHRTARNEVRRQRRYAEGGKSMSENRSCSAFLGIYVAEKMLSQLFKNVICMPNNNPGYDFKCGQGYLVDVKSSCEYIRSTGTAVWTFHIRHNTTADFFLCIAFDNRHDLTPRHIWLIPDEVLSHLESATISETTLDKWAKYEKPIDKAICCCDAMKGEIAGRR